MFFSPINGAYLLDQSLKSVEGGINSEYFFRINRSFLVARKSISDISMFSNSRLKLNLKEFKHDDLIVSLEKVSDFKQWIN